MSRASGKMLRVAAVGVLASGAAVGLGSSGVAEANPPSCTPYQLPTLPGGDGSGEVISISAGGLYGGDSVGADGIGHAVYWTHTGSDPATGWAIHQVPSPIVWDFIGDINAHGLMVGTGQDPVTGAGVGYVYDVNTGIVTMLPGLGGGNDYDRRLNDAGVVAGLSTDTHGVGHAVTWSPPYKKVNVEPDAGASQSFGTKDFSHYKAGQDATGINNVGQVVGSGFSGGRFADPSVYAREHLWRGAVAPLLVPLEWQANGSPKKLPTGNQQGQAWAINDAGLVVGNIFNVDTGAGRPTAWVNGAPVDMGAPAGIDFGNAYGLSQGGWAAGGYDLPDGSGTRAFTWSQSGGFVSLDPPAGESESWSHGASDTLRQIGGEADDGNTGVPVVWQC